MQKKNDFSTVYVGQSTRMGYIDCMRAFAIFLVVMMHVDDMTFGLTLSQSLLLQIIVPVALPAFFFISGFVGYKMPQFFNHKSVLKGLLVKARTLLLPTMLFWLLGCIILKGAPIVMLPHLFAEWFPWFCWFTLALFVMYAIYYGSALLSKKMGEGWMFLILTGIYLLIFLFQGRLPESLASHLTLPELRRFFLFFILGLLSRKYYAKLQPILKNRIAARGGLIISVILGYVVYYKCGTDHSCFSLLLTSLSVPLLFLIFSVFYRFSDSCESMGWPARVMRLIGRRTLDIYMIHFFLLPKLPEYTHYFLGKGGEIAQLLVFPLMAVILVMLSMMISYVLRLNPVVAKYLLGANS